MDYNKIVKNVDILNGLDGLKSLLDCTWEKEKKTIVLKYIANRYGFVTLNSKDDMKLLPSLLENKEIKVSSICSDRSRLAKEHGISLSKVKPIGNGKFIIRGKVYE